MGLSLLSNAFIASGGRVINTGLGLVVTLLLSRHFGPAPFGVYSVLLAYGALWQLAADLGLYLTLTREIGRFPARERQYISEVLSLRLALLALALSLALGVAAFIPSLTAYRLPLAIVAAGLLFQSLSQLLMGVYQQHSAVWRATVGDLLGRAVQLAIIIGFLIAGAGAAASMGASLYGMVGAFAAGSAAAFAVHHYLLPRASRYAWAYSWPRWKALLKTSWPLGAMLVLNAVYFRIDMLILSYFREPAVVGHYALAYRVIESCLFFPAMLGGLLLPRLTEALRAATRERAQQLVSECLHVVLVVGAWLVLLLWLKSDAIILFLGRQAFADAAGLLQILSGALAAIFFGTIFGFALIALQQQRVLLWLYAALVVVNIAANLLFIPRWGAPAAAWATVLTECLSAGWAAIVVYRHLRYRVSGFFVVRVAIITLLTAALVLALPPSWHIIAQVAAATLLYGALSVFAGLATKRQFPLLTSRPAL